MSDQQQRRPSRIPQFTSREEEAEWYVTHDLADYWDEFQPVTAKVSPHLLSETAMSLRLSDTTLERLRQRAAKKGLGHTTLARLWIMERLEQEENADAPSR